ncbi:proline-rich protein 27 isoform X2 [Zalophus californianus]|uniref:Proline-rich protein 27 isoform X2 n=1 Tax=Zalophus californianus TaxID=9704 RepID=A0A6J2DIG8_ZALCA|nr:proline-rich protein 27 isoform X2 [Zalophus californianus]
MKFLLLAYILCVSFAKKVLSSGEEDYSDNHYPLDPSLNILYPTSGLNFAPPFRPSRNKIPSYPGNPDPDSGVPSYPWILNSPGALLYHSPSFTIITSSVPSSPQISSYFVPPLSRLEGPFIPLSASMPVAAEPHISTPLVTTPTTPPNPKLIAVEPGPLESDEAEPAASEPQPS